MFLMKQYLCLNRTVNRVKKINLRIANHILIKRFVLHYMKCEVAVVAVFFCDIINQILDCYI